MKSLYIKISSLLLVLALLFGALVSCGGETVPPSDGTGNGETPDVGETPEDGENGENGGEDTSVDPFENNPDLISDPDFDYAKSDLSPYITLPEEKYKNFELTLDIAKPHPIDVDVAILSALYSERDKEAGERVEYPSGVAVTAGDEVEIYYRGYLEDEDGREIFFANMCNYNSAKPSTLGIGSGHFVPGFELSLVGKNPADHGTLTRVTEGRPTEDSFAYVSYKRTLDGKSESVSLYRIDMSGDVDSILGEGAKLMLLGSNIGERIEKFPTTLGGAACEYSYITVDLVTYESDPIKVEVYFPYSYQVAELRNATAYFDVFVTAVTPYGTPTYDDEYVTDIISQDGSPITAEELSEYEGATLSEKYKSYAAAMMYKSYEAELKELLEEEIWNYYLKDGVATVEKYPLEELKRIYGEYVADVTAQYESSGGIVYNQYTGSYEKCDSIDGFAEIYLGIQYTEKPDWRGRLYDTAKMLVRERLILFHIMRNEKILPGESEVAEGVEKLKREYLDEYMAQYLEYNGKTREDYTDEEYEKLVAERSAELFEYFGEDYFTETVYFNTAMKVISTYPNIKTLDK